MRSNLEKRLEELAAHVQARANAPIWVYMHGCTVRINEGMSRGETLTFPTVYEAAQHVEAAIDAHDQATGSISVDHLADLYPDGDALRQRLRRILPEPIHASGGTFSADNLSGVKFGGLKTNRAADVRLLMLAGVIYHYFGHGDFHQRYRDDIMSADDNRMFTALLVVWLWDKPEGGAELVRQFVALVHQAAHLPAPHDRNQAAS